MLFVLSLCTDEHSLYDAKRYQHMCIDKLLQEREIQELNEFAAEKGLHDNALYAHCECSWRGIECDNGLMWRMAWDANHFHDGYQDSFPQQNIHDLKLHIEWLPPTLVFLDLSDFPLEQKLNTEMLPRSLKQLNMSVCRLRGPLSVGGLPACLEVAKLHRNQFSGILRLVDLPSELRVLWLSRNLFHTIVIRNAGIPECTERIVAYQDRKKDPRIIILDGKDVHESIQLHRAKKAIR